MKTIIDETIKEDIDVKEIKTPIDKRTKIRKRLIKNALAVTDCRNTEFGFYSFLTIGDVLLFNKPCLN